jgi:hypothetical protein
VPFINVLLSSLKDNFFTIDDDDDFSALHKLNKLNINKQII